MNRLDLAQRSRSLVRDLSNSFFRDVDITNYLNEGIDRIAQIIPELENMPYLNHHTQEVTYLPKKWQHLLAIYCASRLCAQDERHYQAGTFMNEFETKLDKLASDVISGDIEILDEEGNPVDITRKPVYVRNRYFTNKRGFVPQSDEVTINLFVEDDDE